MAMGTETPATCTLSSTVPSPGQRRPSRRPSAMAAKIHSGRKRSSVERRRSTGVSSVVWAATAGGAAVVMTGASAGVIGESGRRSRARVVFALVHAGFSAGPLVVQRLNSRETRTDARNQVAMHRVLRLGQAIVRELPLARCLHESRAAEVGEVPRDGGLRQSEDLDDVADAQLTRGKQAEYPDARGVGEALEEFVEDDDSRR